MKTKKNSRKSHSRRSLHGVVSRPPLNRVSVYTNPDDPDGTKLVMPGLVDERSLELAAGHFGCDKDRITTRSRMVTDKYLEALPEYEG
jgi:hypothetical protein